MRKVIKNDCALWLVVLRWGIDLKERLKKMYRDVFCCAINYTYNRLKVKEWKLMVLILTVLCVY